MSHKKNNKQANVRKPAKSLEGLPELPKSCTSMTINMIGAFILLCVLGIMNWVGEIPVMLMTIIALLAYMVPIATLEMIYLKVHRNPSTGLDYSRWGGGVQWSRVLVKLLGLYATLGATAFIYFFIPEYFKSSFYHRYWNFLGFVAPAYFIGTVVYFSIVDGLMDRPKDSFWHMGMFVLGRFKEVDRSVWIQHALGWLVKLFFLPLMFIYTLNFLNGFVKYDFTRWLDFSMSNEAYSYSVSIFYGVDVIAVTVGYICTLRILDTHVRSTEPTAAGWLWALICYEPIWSFASVSYLAYNADRFEWWQWLSGSLTLSAIWGTAITVLTLIYVLASIVFGLRFSNLTNRGILTNGVYSWCKHPAYVSKNLSWWLIAVPFILHPGATPYTAARDSILLLCLNGVYFIRARTEERHLSSDPIYVQYALAMNQRSVFAWLGRLIPLLQYRPGPVLVKLK